MSDICRVEEEEFMEKREKLSDGFLPSLFVTPSLNDDKISGCYTLICRYYYAFYFDYFFPVAVLGIIMR